MKLVCSVACNRAFKVACILATAVMIGFWILEFLKNEDTSVIEYKNFEEIEDTRYPELSLCFLRPFLAKKLRAHNSNLTFDSYWKYIEGKKSFGESYMDITFNNVTFNLFDYLKNYQMQFNSNKELMKYTCKDAHNCKHIILKKNFDGLFDNVGFFRCFGIRIKRQFEKQVKVLVLHFKASLENELSQMRKDTGINDVVTAVFNYPQQIYRYSENVRYIWKNPNEGNIINLFTITKMEVLKRRNKHGEPCLANWMQFDDFISNNHLEKKNCRAPYQTTQKRICTTPKEMLDANYRLSDGEKREYQAPCQEMSSITYTFNTIRYDSKEAFFQLQVSYPRRIRSITQSKSVNIHSLIGNIGGYIGLFLGKSFSILTNYQTLFLYSADISMKCYCLI